MREGMFPDRTGLTEFTLHLNPNFFVSKGTNESSSGTKFTNLVII